MEKDLRASKCHCGNLATNHRAKESQKCWFHQASAVHIMRSHPKATPPPGSASLSLWCSEQGSSQQCPRQERGPVLACSPTWRHSLLYRQALQETKGTSFCLSFLNTALVHRHVCVHKRIKQANLFVWLKTFNCLFLSILWFCYYWRHTINEGENYMEAE